MNKYSHIIWDWNGTIIDDSHWTRTVVNSMLKKRNMKTLDTLEEYHKHFDFPIIKYYERLGFDFEIESYDLLAKEFIEKYQSGDVNCELHKNVTRLIRNFNEKGFNQAIISASETSNLIEQVKRYQIDKYFDEILGTGDIYANSKIAVGQNYFNRNRIEKAIFIGDTSHDFEVANNLNIDCVLVAKGHQSKERLLETGARVIDDISELEGIII